MGDALLILGMLTGLVAVFVFLWWDIDNTRRKADRWIHVRRLQQETLPESVAWAEFWFEAQVRADELLAPVEAVERLHALLQEPPRLEVVG